MLTEVTDVRPAVSIRPGHPGTPGPGRGELDLGARRDHLGDSGHQTGGVRPVPGQAIASYPSKHGARQLGMLPQSLNVPGGIVMKAGRVLAQRPPAEVMTADLVEDVFANPCRVIDDPETGTPMVVPADRHRRRVSRRAKPASGTSSAFGTTEAAPAATDRAVA